METRLTATRNGEGRDGRLGRLAIPDAEEAVADTRHVAEVAPGHVHRVDVRHVVRRSKRLDVTAKTGRVDALTRRRRYPVALPSDHEGDIRGWLVRSFAWVVRGREAEAVEELVGGLLREDIAAADDLLDFGSCQRLGCAC